MNDSVQMATPSSTRTSSALILRTPSAPNIEPRGCTSRGARRQCAGDSVPSTGRLTTPRTKSRDVLTLARLFWIAYLSPRANSSLSGCAPRFSNGSTATLGGPFGGPTGLQLDVPSATPAATTSTAAAAAMYLSRLAQGETVSAFNSAASAPALWYRARGSGSMARSITRTSAGGRSGRAAFNVVAAALLVRGPHVLNRAALHGILASEQVIQQNAEAYRSLCTVAASPRSTSGAR